MKMNIYLDTLIFGKQRIGGISVVWNEYLKRMITDKRINLTLLTINNYVNNEYMSLNKESVKLIKEKNNNIGLLRLFKLKLKEKKKGLFQSTYLRICKNKNVKNIIMIHDCTHQYYIKGFQKFLNTNLKRRALKNADGIVCVSESTKRDIQKLFPFTKSKPFKVIYNSASEEYRPLRKAIIPDRYKSIKGKKYFIYVGERFPYKNTDMLFRLLKTDPELNCVLIGGKEYSNEEKELMKGLENRVFRFTRVPNNELNILYNNAHCLIYPSLYEGFGIPVLEAMKSGCPVIAFNNSSIPEVLRGSGILLENNDIKGCIKYLEELNDQDYRNKVIESQLKQSKFFSWDKSYNELIDFYRDIYQ